VPNDEPLYVGDRAGLSTTFRDTNGVATDTVVSRVAVRRPNGSTVDIVTDVAHVGTGQYTAPYVIDQSGRHFFKFYGSNPLIAAPEDYFDVELQRVV
jgi:hypothetical protein